MISKINNIVKRRRGNLPLFGGLTGAIFRAPAKANESVNGSRISFE